jgi:hypothetical protein
MFDGECAILIQLPSGENVSLFADKSLIQEIKGEMFLKVNVVQKDEGNGERTILLPSESFETGSRWLNMPTENLVPA